MRKRSPRFRSIGRHAPRTRDTGPSVPARQLEPQPMHAYEPFLDSFLSPFSPFRKLDVQWCPDQKTNQILEPRSWRAQQSTNTKSERRLADAYLIRCLL